MEQQDRGGLAQILQPEDQHRGLQRHRPDHQGVVAGQRRVRGPEDVGEEDDRQHRAAEHARPGLLQAEHQELEQPPPGSRPVGERLQAREQRPPPPLDRQLAPAVRWRGRLTARIVDHVRLVYAITCPRAPD